METCVHRHEFNVVENKGKENLTTTPNAQITSLPGPGKGKPRKTSTSFSQSEKKKFKFKNTNINNY